MRRPPRTLIVEDNPLILENLSEMFEELGIAEIVGTATAQSDACSWTDRHTQACDVAIIDIFLSSGSGLGVLKHMATYDAPPERVVLTNYPTDDIRRHCAELGAAAIFDKSTELDELIAWLESRIRH